MAQEIAHRATMELALEGPATGLRKWMPQCAILALTAGSDGFDERFARRKLGEERLEARALLAMADEAIAPTRQDWLAERLRLHWKSSTPTNAMEAKSWLHETGRLLKHLPQDILAHSIDEAIRCSGNGFTLTAGAILAVADPLYRERQAVRARLDLIVNGPGRRPSYPWERDKAEEAKTKTRCSPEEAASILREYGLDASPACRSREDRGRDYSKLREPSPSELRDLAREFGNRHYGAGPAAGNAGEGSSA